MMRKISSIQARLTKNNGFVGLSSEPILSIRAEGPNQGFEFIKTEGEKYT